tara:strand:- start:826 stop:1998 length:1173 start_codon:yes stop_codon:yes gene_type:complete
MTGMIFGKGTGSAKGLPKKTHLTRHVPNHLEGGRMDLSSIDVQKPPESRSGRSDAPSIVTDPTQDQIDKAIRAYEKAEKNAGIASVTRGDMNDNLFDILVNHGGPKGGSFIENRMVEAVYGSLDNPYGDDSNVWEEGDWTANKSPSVRKMQKKFQKLYQNVMNDPSNPNYTPGYSDNPDFVTNKMAKDISKKFITEKRPTRLPDPLRDNPLYPPEATDEEIAAIDAETKLIDDTGEKKDDTGGEEFDPADTNQDGYVDKWEKKDFEKSGGEEEIITEGEGEGEEGGKEGEETFDPADTNKDGYVDKWERKDAEKGGGEEVMVEGGEEGGGEPIPGDTNNDGYLDKWEKKDLAKATESENPAFAKSALKKKRESARKLGLTKSVFNMYKNY